MFWFLGKVQTSDPISQFYSSLWKPWSYLTGSSEAKPTGTDDPDVTSQTTSIKGCFLKKKINLKLADLWQHKSAGNITYTSSTGSMEASSDVLPSNWTGLVDLEEEEETNPSANACKRGLQYFDALHG